MPTGDFTLFCVGRPEYALFAPVRMFGFSALGGSTLTLTASTNPQGSAYRISAECNSGFFVTDVNWSGTRSNNGQFDVIIITQKGGLLTFYKNGRIVPQSTYNGGAAIFNDVINSPASGSGLSIANPPTGPWFAAQLDVAECGVYDNALSDTEIGELFGSMSDKYGIPVVGHNAPASISEISGLWAWQKNGHGFYTDAGVTPVADQGDLVYQWSDQSGQGHHWIQTGDGFRATYDGETTTGALLFDSSLQQHYQLPNMSGLTQATIFICVRAFNDPGIAGGVGSGLWALGTDNNAEVAFPDVNGNILDDVGRPSAVSGGNPVASLSTQYRVYSIRVGGVGAQIFSLDYDTITSQTSTTVTFPTTPYVGRTRGNSTGGVKYFLGRVCEFVVFDRRLSDIEHESVINDILERV
jgi:hypothetical protein